MSPQLQQIGAQLSMVVEIAKGVMGDQFAVTVLCRHRAGPMHLLIGDDNEPAMIVALNDLARGGTALIKDGVVDEKPPTPLFDQMAELLNECADRLANVGASTEAKDDQELATRIEQVLDAGAPKPRTCPRCVEMLSANTNECPTCKAKVTLHD